MELIEEKIILKYLVSDEMYFSKVFPFLNESLFSESYTKKMFKCIREYNEKYNRRPNIPVIELFVEQVKGVSASDYAEMQKIVEFMHITEEYNYEWLCDKTLEFIKNRSYFDALAEAAEKYDKGILDTDLPDKLNESLSITFDSEIGMDFDDAEKRWDMMNEHEDRIPFLVERLNEATKGGVTRKTLNCFVSSTTGGFKSGMMCSLACDYRRLGYNVLYLTFEMAENKIMERIDANMLDIEIDNLTAMGKDAFITRISTLKNSFPGKFKVKQYPTSMCHAGHIRYLLKELKLKENFIPDVIMFDYLGIMSSLRYRDNVQEHIILKAACEEVRGLCVEYNVIGWTAMQSNRSGASAGVDLSLSDISASFGTTFGFDLVFGLVSNEEFDSQHKIMIKQLKNRYSDKNLRPTFFLGLNKGKMKVFDMLDTNNQDLEFSDNTVSDVIKENDDAEMNMFSTRYTRNRTANIGSGFKY